MALNSLALPCALWIGLTQHPAASLAFHTLRCAVLTGTCCAQEAGRAAVIPVAPQTLTASPYLDARLWTYDAQHTCANTRTRPSHEQPLRFTSRENPLARFRLHLHEADPQPTTGRMPKSLLRLLYHPVEPLVLSLSHAYGQPPVMSVSYYD